MLLIASDNGNHQMEVLVLARDAWIPHDDPALKFLTVVALLFEECNDGRIPYVRWQEAIRSLLVDAQPISATTYDTEQAGGSQNVAARPSAGGDTISDRQDVSHKEEIPANTIQDQVIPSDTVRSSAADLPAPSASPRPPARSSSVSPTNVSLPVPSSPRRAQSMSAVTPQSPNTTTNTFLRNSPVETANESSTKSVATHRKSTVADPRPTTSGKSIEYLQKLGLAHNSMLRLKLKRGRGSDGDEEYFDFGDSQDDETHDDGGDDDDDDYVIDPNKRPKKKRRIVSNQFIVGDSDEDVPTPAPRPKAKPRVRDDWPTFPSPDPCPQCLSSRTKCETFVLRPKGRRNQKPRRACTACYLKKKGCLFNQIYREQQQEEQGDRPSKKKKTEVTDHMDTDGERPQQKDKATTDDKGDNGEQSKKVKGKGKAKAKESNEQDDDNDTVPPGQSRNRQVRYRSSKYFILSILF